MLVLTRKINEQIVLPDQGVTVTVLSVSGSRVKLGVSAPPETRILRRELLFHPITPSDTAPEMSDSQGLVSAHGSEPQGLRE